MSIQPEHIVVSLIIGSLVVSVINIARGSIIGTAYGVITFLVTAAIAPMVIVGTAAESAEYACVDEMFATYDGRGDACQRFEKLRDATARAADALM